MRSVDDPSLHLVISAWKGALRTGKVGDTPERKAFEEKIAALLAEPEKISADQTDTYFDVKGDGGKPGGGNRCIRLRNTEVAIKVEEKSRT